MTVNKFKTLLKMKAMTFGVAECLYIGEWDERIEVYVCNTLTGDLEVDRDNAEHQFCNSDSVYEVIFEVGRLIERERLRRMVGSAFKD